MRRFIIFSSLLSLILTSACVAGPSPGKKGEGQALPYRIISFHKGRADKELIQRAAAVGYNGVQFQLEGSNVPKLEEFAQRDKQEGYVDLCHSLGMEITVWVHEFSEIPDKNDPNYLGPVALDNQKLWDHLDKRYDYVLGTLLPNIDGLALTVVESQITVTEKEMMLKLVDVINKNCRKHNKKLIVRTFVWHPHEFEGVMACVKELPPDVIIMSKNVPQDWQMRGMFDKAIGDVGPRRQIVEYDIAGEYFLRTAVANCMPDLLKTHFDYGIRKGVVGICARADRDGDYVTYQPSEVNLWTLGMLATGKATTTDEVWKAWATDRYGADAAPGVIKALKPTARVVTEFLNIGPFTYGDARSFPPNLDGNVFNRNWQNWRWDKSYVPVYEQGLRGDARFFRTVQLQKSTAYRLAQRSLDDLELVKDKLDPNDYAILKTKLMTNQANLQWRAPIMLSYLRYRRILNTEDQDEKQRLAAEIRGYLAQIREVANRDWPEATEIEHKDRKWLVGTPERIDWKRVREWPDTAEAILQKQGL